MMKKFLLICFSFTLTAVSLMAQERMLSGNVTSSENGNPLPNVTVLLKESTPNHSVVTTEDGNYNISLPASGGTLIFSLDGFNKKEVRIEDFSVLDVQLSEIKLKSVFIVIWELILEFLEALLIILLVLLVLVINFGILYGLFRLFIYLISLCLPFLTKYRVPISIVFFLFGGLLIYRLYFGIDSVVESRALIADQEKQMIDRLRLIREAEIVFQEQNGRYTANWDSLADFIENGKVPIINRREEIKQKAYGGEEVILHVDTLGYISAKDRIFKKNYSMSAPEDGVFEKWNSKVQVGSKVLKGMDAYEMSTSGRKVIPKFIENGTIQSLAELMPGENITKGSNMITFWEYQFDINTDIRKIGEVPYMPGTQIQIFVGKVDKNGLMVDVIEVIDPKPANKERKESNTLKTMKPLRFGSRLDASTVGNWE